MTKELLRKEMKQQRGKLTLSERTADDNAIYQRLLSLSQYIKCRNLLTFVSFGTEPDTHRIIRKALLDGKRVYVPRTAQKNMEFYEILSLEGLIPSKFGVPEPSEGRKYSVNEQATLMLMPGLAFDLLGNRIGYGAGYYDRYLSSNSFSNCIKVAVAYDFEVVQSLNAEPHDIRVDLILTPTRMIHCM